MILNNENIKKYDIFQTSSGNYRSRVKNRTYYKCTCKECKNPFLASYKTQPFCSPSCAMLSEDTQEKFKGSMVSRHGVEYNFQNQSILNKALGKSDPHVDDSMKEMMKYLDFPNPRNK
jgi:hypothetical protein